VNNYFLKFLKIRGLASHSCAKMTFFLKNIKNQKPYFSSRKVRDRIKVQVANLGIEVDHRCLKTEVHGEEPLHSSSQLSSLLGLKALGSLIQDLHKHSVCLNKRIFASGQISWTSHFYKIAKFNRLLRKSLSHVL
jgi:hypothetical protein